MSNRVKSPKIVISGYYGFDNCGDEAVLLSMIHCLRKLCPDVRITVLSGNPAKTRKLYGVGAVNRWNPLSIACKLLSCDLFISGGGSLLQDVTSARSPNYYLGVLQMAHFFGRKSMIYAQGVGPLTLDDNRVKTAKVLNLCRAIAVRDSGSADLLRELGVSQNIVVTSDSVMALCREDFVVVECSDELQPEKSESSVLLVSVRRWKDDSHIAKAAEFLDSQAAKGWGVLLVPAHFPDDVEAIAMLRERMATQPLCIEKCLTADEFISLIASADRVFSMRLHGLICAMAVGTPMIGLSYDPKVDAFMELAGLERCCLSFDDFDVAVAKGLMDELDDLPDQTRQKHESRRQELQKLAWRNAEIALDLI